MKLTKTKLKQIIKEEIKVAIESEADQRQLAVFRRLKSGKWGRVADKPRPGDKVFRKDDPVLQSYLHPRSDEDRISYAEWQLELDNLPSNV